MEVTNPRILKVLIRKEQATIRLKKDERFESCHPDQEAYKGGQNPSNRVIRGVFLFFLTPNCSSKAKEKVTYSVTHSLFLILGHQKWLKYLKISLLYLFVLVLFVAV